jgi:hypothetical protein
VSQPSGKRARSWDLRVGSIDLGFDIVTTEDITARTAFLRSLVARK